MDSSSSTLDKIFKLLKTAESFQASGSLEEAAAFMAQVQKMLQEHNLEMADVESHSPTEKKPVTEQQITFGNIKSDGTWELNLMSVICENNFCYNQWNTYYKTHTIIGKSENIQVVQYLYSYCQHALKSLSGTQYSQAILNAVDDYKVMSFGKDLIALLGGKIKAEAWLCRNGLLAWRKVWIRNYLVGAVVGINSKLSEQRRNALSQNSNLMALVKVNSTDIEKYKEQYYPDVKSVNLNYGDNNKGGFREGYRDGKNLNIGKGIEGNVGVTKQLN